jgi:hypothetical protein
MTVSPSALTTAIGKVSLSTGIDGLTLLQTLNGARSGELLKLLRSSAQAALQRLAHSDAVAQFLGRLLTLPDTPDGQGKVLGAVTAGQRLPSAEPRPAAELLAQASSLNFDLPAQKWLYTRTDTLDADWNLVGSTAPVLSSPAAVADIKSNNDYFGTYTNEHDGAMVVYQGTTGSGDDARITHTYVLQDQGEWRIDKDDLALLATQVTTEAARQSVALDQEMGYLAAFCESLSSELTQDRYTLDNAARQQDKVDERHQAVVLAVNASPIETTGEQQP